jgi:P-type Ca2+ transporter type 2C
MVFTALAFCQMYHVLAIRSERESTLAIGVFSNLPLTGAAALTVALQLALVYVPALNPIFNTHRLTWEELAVSTLLPGLVFVGVEIEKWMVRMGWIYQPRPSKLEPSREVARSASARPPPPVRQSGKRGKFLQLALLNFSEQK